MRAAGWESVESSPNSRPAAALPSRVADGRSCGPIGSGGKLRKYLQRLADCLNCLQLSDTPRFGLSSFPENRRKFVGPVIDVATASIPTCTSEK